VLFHFTVRFLYFCCSILHSSILQLSFAVLFFAFFFAGQLPFKAYPYNLNFLSLSLCFSVPSSMPSSVPSLPSSSHLPPYYPSSVSYCCGLGLGLGSLSDIAATTGSAGSAPASTFSLHPFYLYLLCHLYLAILSTQVGPLVLGLGL
jgi:hypothetical protein